MTKSIYRPEYEVFLEILKRKRQSTGLTQVDCSNAIGRPQSFMSDVERGTRRLDIVQTHDLCKILGCSLLDIVREFEEKIQEGNKNDTGRL